jgi:glucose/arabinose dehydrogenase
MLAFVKRTAISFSLLHIMSSPASADIFPSEAIPDALPGLFQADLNPDGGGVEPYLSSSPYNAALTAMAGPLEYPRSIAFLPNGDILITEKPGPPEAGALRVCEFLPVAVTAAI